MVTGFLGYEDDAEANSMQATLYGSMPSIEGEDVSSQYTLSIDCTSSTAGWTDKPNDPQPKVSWLPPGTVTHAVFATVGECHPVGEVIVTIEGKTIHIVAKLTQRPGVLEIQPDQLRAMVADPAYRKSIVEYFGQ